MISDLLLVLEACEIRPLSPLGLRHVFRPFSPEGVRQDSAGRQKVIMMHEISCSWSAFRTLRDILTDLICSISCGGSTLTHFRLSEGCATLISVNIVWCRSGYLVVPNRQGRHGYIGSCPAQLPDHRLMRKWRIEVMDQGLSAPTQGTEFRTELRLTYGGKHGASRLDPSRMASRCCVSLGKC